jgi:hypothetical protein
MKVVLRSSSPLLSLLGIPAVPTAPEAMAVLRRGSADRVYIGMSALDVLAEFNERAEFNELNSMADIFLGPGKQRHPDLSLELTDGVVTGIQVYSPRYKTETGVGPGDNLITLANQYELRWTADNTAEVGELKMRFQFEKDRIISVLLS